MNAITYINERGGKHCALTTPFESDVDAWPLDIRRVDYSTYNPRLYKPSTHQRCFSQFDRKTDCFDGNERTVRTIPRKSGVAGNPAKYKSGWRWQGLGRRVRPFCDGRLGRNPSVTFKAVCGTQTRHGGSVNKNQPDSQIGRLDTYGSYADCNPVPKGSVGSIPTAPTIWQKPRRVPTG